MLNKKSKGIIVVNRNKKHAWKAHVPLDDTSRHLMDVGSGDALVGGFAIGLLRKMSLKESIRLGVACGTANLFTLGPGMCKSNDIKRLMGQVQFEEIKNEN